MERSNYWFCQFLNKSVEKKCYVVVFWLELNPSALGLGLELGLGLGLNPSPLRLGLGLKC